MADIRNFGLAAGFTIAAVARQSWPNALNEGGDEVLETAFACLRRRHHPARAPFISTGGRDRPPVSALGDARNETA